MTHHYALFSARFAPQVGGIEKYTESLARELLAGGDAVTVVTSCLSGEAGTEVREDGITVVRLPAFSFMDGRLPVSKKNVCYRALFHDLSEVGIDRVLVNTRFYRHSLEGLRFAQAAGVPALVLDHGSDHLSLGNAPADAVIQCYEHYVTKKVQRFQPRFAGVSQKSLEWLVHFGINTHTIIPNGIDAMEFRTVASSRNLRQECGVEPSDVLIVFVGRITPEKGPDKLLEAFGLLDFDHVHLVLAGEGFMRGALEATCARQVHFVGLLNRADLSALLQQADIFCLPSRSEGFCTSLLEASAWGVPAVVTDFGGAQEIIPNPEYGRIIDSSNPVYIAEALRDLCALSPDARKEIGARAQAQVEKHYTWHNTACALRSAFE